MNVWLYVVATVGILVAAGIVGTVIYLTCRDFHRSGPPGGMD